MAEGAEENPESDGASIARTSEALSEFDKISQEIALEVQKLVDKTISVKKCQENISLIIQQRVGGKLSEENKKFIDDHVANIHAAFVSRSGKDAAKEAFYSFIAILGKSLSVIGTGFVFLGASATIVDTSSQIMNWCYSNIFQQVQGVIKNNKDDFTKAVLQTTGVVSQVTGVLGTTVMVVGVVVSIGALLNSFGKNIEQNYTTNIEYVKLNKLSVEEKEKLKVEVTRSIAEIMPLELMRYKREARKTIQALNPEKRAKLEKGVVTAWERFISSKARQEKTAAQKKQEIAGMISKTKEHLVKFEAAKNIRREKTGNIVEKEHQENDGVEASEEGQKKEPKTTWVRKERERKSHVKNTSSRNKS